MIENNLLVEAKYQPSPNKGGALRNPTLIVAHYTAGRTAQSAADWLREKAAKASAHIVIGRDGTLIQLVPFNVVSWHAGPSQWQGREGCNSFSIGIELDNPGWVVKDVASGRWRSLGLGSLYADKDVFIDNVGKGWVKYTLLQIALFIDIVKQLRTAYPTIIDVAGHSDICVPFGRKIDPGNLFWDQLREAKL